MGTGTVAAICVVVGVVIITGGVEAVAIIMAGPEAGTAVGNRTKERAAFGRLLFYVKTLT